MPGATSSEFDKSVVGTDDEVRHVHMHVHVHHVHVAHTCTCTCTCHVHVRVMSMHVHTLRHYAHYAHYALHARGPNSDPNPNPNPKPDPNPNPNQAVLFMPEGSTEQMGGTMRLGSRSTHLTPNSLGSAIYGGATVVAERHRHRYEVHPNTNPNPNPNPNPTQVIVNVGRAGAANLDVIQEVEYVKQESSEY